MKLQITKDSVLIFAADFVYPKYVREYENPNSNLR
jgi:hypothetical protein